jgi:hypothetical protein
VRRYGGCIVSVVRVAVSLFRPTDAKGSWAFAGIGGGFGHAAMFDSARTDEHGEFRSEGVIPGQYFLTVRVSHQPSSKISVDLVNPLRRQARSASSVILPVRELTVSRMAVMPISTYHAGPLSNPLWSGPDGPSVIVMAA